MNEITKVILENEMDLLLANKQCMKLAELVGLPVSSQTTFATAVSEIARTVISEKTDAYISLNISEKKDTTKFICAVLHDKRKNFSEKNDEGYAYAKKLVHAIKFESDESGNKIELRVRIAASFRIDDIVIEKLRVSLNTDPAVSPYEEIKRKNKQLVELADRLRISEQQYKSLTDSLPLMIFSTDSNRQISFANKWLFQYTGETAEGLNETMWSRVLHPDDLQRAYLNLKKYKSGEYTNVIIPEIRLKQASDGEYRWHKGISIAVQGDDGSLKSWNTYIVDIHAQKMIEQALKDNVHLREIQNQLEEKVAQLNNSNRQLEQFAYIAAHDLQEPLRKITFYSDLLETRYADNLPQEAHTFLNSLVQSSIRMKNLIQDVLAYSTINKEEFTLVSLQDIAAETLLDLEISAKEKKAEIHIGRLPRVKGNPAQLKQLFENIISNALKFTRKGISPVISVSAEMNNGDVSISFKDNGIGFNDTYIEKAFGLFQRLQTRDNYKGTGIGLAICKKIVALHNGSITAKGEPDNGATFIVTLPMPETT